MKLKGNLSTVAVILLLALLFNYYAYVNNEVNYRVADSPDENLPLIFSKIIVEESSLVWHSEMNEKYNVSYFRPRNSIDIGGNNYIGPYVGFQILLAAARLYGLLDYIVPLAGCVGVLFLYLLVRNIFDDKTAIIAALIWGLNPYICILFQYVLQQYSCSDLFDHCPLLFPQRHKNRKERIHRMCWFVLSVCCFYQNLRNSHIWIDIDRTYCSKMGIYQKDTIERDNHICGYLPDTAYLVDNIQFYP